MRKFVFFKVTFISEVKMLFLEVNCNLISRRTTSWGRSSKLFFWACAVSFFSACKIYFHWSHFLFREWNIFFFAAEVKLSHNSHIIGRYRSTQIHQTDEMALLDLFILQTEWWRSLGWHCTASRSGEWIDRAPFMGHRNTTATKHVPTVSLVSSVPYIDPCRWFSSPNMNMICFE